MYIKMFKKKQQEIIMLRASALIPKYDSKECVASAPIAPPQSSPYAVLGAQDPRAFTQEAKQWITEVSDSRDADMEFWSKKAPTKQSRLWNDPAVPDSLFAFDANIPDARQRPARR
jgi:hypothetical protein